MDKSDENSCNMVFIDPKTYQKDYPPLSDIRNETLEIKINILLFAIEKIMEIDMTFQTKLALKLEWKDHRLTYYNLKERSDTNIVGMSDRKKMWIPPLVFNNTNEMIRAKNDEDTMIVIRRLGQHIVAPIEELDEKYLYLGAENSIMFVRPYMIKQGCNFKLQNYPFDTQICTIEVTIEPKL